jgi:hypothetical protein
MWGSSGDARHMTAGPDGAVGLSLLQPIVVSNASGREGRLMVSCSLNPRTL